MSKPVAPQPKAPVQPQPPPPPVAKLPQGLAMRHLYTHDGKVTGRRLAPEQGGQPVFHAMRKLKQQGVILIDPASMVTSDGQDPVLAFPKEKGGWCIRRCNAAHAAKEMTVDVETGLAPRCRFATDEEVAWYKLVYEKEADLAKLAEKKAAEELMASQPSPQ